MNKNFSNYIVVEIPNKNKYTKLPLCTKVDKKIVYIQNVCL